MESYIWPVYNFLFIFVFSISIVLIFILLFMKKNKKANINLALFILIIASTHFTHYLHIMDYKTIAFYLTFFSVPGISVAGVFIYFYAIFITGLTDRFKPVHLLHFIVFFIILIIFLISTLHYNFKIAASGKLQTYFVFLLGVGLINSSCYIFYTLLIIIKKYNRKIENYYSDIEQISFNWLFLLTTLLLVSLIYWCIGFWLSAFKIINIIEPLAFIINILLFIIIFFITIYYIINQPEIFKQNLVMNVEIDNPQIVSETNKYSKQNIDINKHNEYLDKLKLFMINNKPYLNEDLTIRDLSLETDIPIHHLSMVINNLLNKNFYTFINEYRVQEAINILSDPANKDANILSIAFRSGFNSKTTFNSAFRKIIGMTPTTYRDTQISKNNLSIID